MRVILYMPPGILGLARRSAVSCILRYMIFFFRYYANGGIVYANGRVEVAAWSFRPVIELAKVGFFFFMNGEWWLLRRTFIRVERVVGLVGPSTVHTCA
jgi:hypothetical protein